MFYFKQAYNIITKIHESTYKEFLARAISLNQTTDHSTQLFVYHNVFLFRHKNGC